MLEELWLDLYWDELSDKVDDIYNIATDVVEEEGIDSELEDNILSEFSEYISTSEVSELESSSDEESDLESQ